MAFIRAEGPAGVRASVEGVCTCFFFFSSKFRACVRVERWSWSTSIPARPEVATSPRALPPSLPTRQAAPVRVVGSGSGSSMDQRQRLLSFRVGASGIGRRCHATGSISVASKPATVRPTDRPATWPRDQLHKRYRDCEQKGFLNSRGSMPLPLALPCLPALPAGIVFIYAGYCEEGKGQAPSR